MTSGGESFDLIIVGSGAASVTAALAAKARGCTSVILEKQALFGGSTAYSAGVVWIPNSPLHGADDSEDAARTYLNAVIAHTGDPGCASPVAKREMFIKQAPEAIRFLMDHGLKFIRVFWPDYYSNLPGGHAYGRALMCKLFDSNELGAWKEKLGFFYGYPRLPMNSNEFITLSLAKRTWRGKFAAMQLATRLLLDRLTGAKRMGSGQGLQGRLLQAALRNQIPIRLSTAVTGLVMQDGRVTGVRVKDDTGERTITARRGVLLNTGGFARNLEMRQTYQPGPISPSWTMSNPGDTGDGIAMGRGLGAAIDIMNEVWWTPGSLRPDGLFAGFHVPGQAGKPHIIIVNAAGRRFGNESGSYMEFGQRMYRTGSVPAWAILESRAVERYLWGPIRPGVVIQTLVDNGYLKRAETLHELAAQCGIDPQGLDAEVARFNAFADAGRDDDFQRGESAHNRLSGDPTNRPHPNLGRIDRAPFYAVQVVPLDVGTAGGLVTDEYARVLKDDGSIIPGLYATGNASAPLAGRSYPGAGASIGVSLAFGYVAAKHATGANF